MTELSRLGTALAYQRQPESVTPRAFPVPGPAGVGEMTGKTDIMLFPGGTRAYLSVMQTPP